MTQLYGEEKLMDSILFMMATSYSGDGSGGMKAHNKPNPETFCLHCAAKALGTSECIMDLHDEFVRQALIIFRMPRERAIELLGEQFQITQPSFKMTLGKCMPVRQFVKFVCESAWS